MVTKPRLDYLGFKHAVKNTARIMYMYDKSKAWGSRSRRVHQYMTHAVLTIRTKERDTFTTRSSMCREALTISTGPLPFHTGKSRDFHVPHRRLEKK